MKFTVSQSALAKALSVVSKGMATNSTLPLLSGVIIRAERGVLEFKTTNLTISIRHKIAANVEEPGETVVSGKILANIVKTLPDAAVSFSLEGRSLTISCEKSTFKLNTLDPADFPASRTSPSPSPSNCRVTSSHAWSTGSIASPQRTTHGPSSPASS